MNLVGNAIKFTETGEITVRVDATGGEGAATVVRFEVSDTGVGIPTDKLALIFEPFVQADTSTSRKYGGTGLGLAISGQLVALMGGTCGASSELDAGSTFWFTICVAPGRQALSGELGRLLLAEDNPINQKVAVAILSKAGYHVDTVPNGEAAVVATTTHSYDAVLMDCHMPGMNGYEATAAIRAQEGVGHHTPIIAITAGARQEDRERCLAEGMDSYLAKPIDKDELLAVVAHALSNASPAADMTVDTEILDQLRVLGGTAEEDFLGELVDQFVKDTEPLLVQLRGAFEGDDAPTVGRIAHAIKGSCGQLGDSRRRAVVWNAAPPREICPTAKPRFMNWNSTIRSCASR
jgi:CheY-like chemotaxis protein